MARKVNAATVTLDKSLDKPISDAELVVESDEGSEDENKAILKMDKSADMGEALAEHELANVFPPMSDAEFDSLKLNIWRNGQLLDIYTFEGAIIDGRHRYRACRELGIEPRVVPWKGDGSATSFVVGMNLDRRHLDTSQRAAIGAELLPFYEAEAAKRMRSGTTVAPEQKGMAAEFAAEAMNVSPRLIASAKKLQKEAPHLLAQVARGEMTINKAVTTANELPNADGTPRVPVARQGKNPPAEERAEGAITDLIDHLEMWINEYGRVPSLKPVSVECRKLVKFAKAAQEEGMDADIDTENFNANDYVPFSDDEDEPTDSELAELVAISDEEED